MPLQFAHSNEEMMRLNNLLGDERAGAHVVFLGRVRCKNHQKNVSHLDYEAHPQLAVQEFACIEERAHKKFALLSIDAVHRVGVVLVGDAAVVVNVRAVHREPAFMAARFIMNELKKSVPIWKCEYYDDGSKSWDQGLCQCSENDRGAEPVKKALLGQKIEVKSLASKKILLIGAGGLGCPLAINLSSLGIAHITVMDHDVVSESNLWRQYCFSRANIGAKKVFVLGDFLRERFLNLHVQEHDCKLSSKNISLVKNYDAVFDATDCMKTKIMLAKACWRYQIPFISSSVYQAEGEVSVISSHRLSACFSCFRRKSIAVNCSDSGVFTHTCSMIAARAAEEGLALLGTQKINNRLIIWHRSSFDEFELKKDPNCSVCSPLRLSDSAL
ncbi:MAG: ThiF family adenylyltransferase [Myxococcales bacterium]|nr:ThiF family adenylyltransferase [Myxococcales bacterium]USN50577.1 MAG: ThiF family adenylyltransferase [Myxococcales bacterium]